MNYFRYQQPCSSPVVACADVAEVSGITAVLLYLPCDLLPFPACFPTAFIVPAPGTACRVVEILHPKSGCQGTLHLGELKPRSI